MRRRYQKKINFAQMSRTLYYIEERRKSLNVGK